MAFPGRGRDNGPFGCLLRDGCVPLGDLAPVDRVPPRVDVVRTVVLVGGRDDRETGALVDEPGPARAELADAGVLHLGLEVVEGAEGVVDGLGEVAVGR